MGHAATDLPEAHSPFSTMGEQDAGSRPGRKAPGAGLDAQEGQAPGSLIPAARACKQGRPREGRLGLRATVELLVKLLTIKTAAKDPGESETCSQRSEAPVPTNGHPQPPHADCAAEDRVA